jgi:hypothetical protein
MYGGELDAPREGGFAAGSDARLRDLPMGEALSRIVSVDSVSQEIACRHAFYIYYK